MLTISISAEAFEAIAATLADGYEAEARPDGKAGVVVNSTRPRTSPRSNRDMSSGFRP
jgi:hypothetical protein